MDARTSNLPDRLAAVVSQALPRADRFRKIVAALRESGNYRWIGLYDVDYGRQRVVNVVWDGPGPPEFLVFPLSKGLTGSAVRERRTVNVGDVDSHPHYLTAFSSTKSEIIVPIFGSDGTVLGTIDIESERPSAFDTAIEQLLERCAEVLRPLWSESRESATSAAR